MHKTPKYHSLRAFTLIELLVVIAIIALLLAVVVPAMKKAKEQAKLVCCMSNMKQLGMIFQLYLLDDRLNRFPYSNEQAIAINGDFDFAYGGYEQTVFGLIVNLPEPEERLFYAYTKAFDVYKCPADKGMDLPLVGGLWEPSVYESLGNSYRYNYYLWGNDPREGGVDDPFGILDKTESWVPSPSRYILLHEPPALRWAYGDLYFIWHSPKTAETTVADPSYADNKFLSNILFVDGHVGTHDFTEVLQDPATVVEPTGQWKWYKPGDETPIW
jgi:prepilin-type N-terminal cleavage/methylation domain-containing protein/prepilin-type processing-associated H-X9-DG protein